MAGPDAEFLKRSKDLEKSYLESDNPLSQSGFAGERDRWVAERSPLVDAIDRDGDFLDVGCANGMLAEDVVDWAAARGIAVIPHGVDLGAGLIALARDRLPEFADNFVATDAWTWDPGRRWTYVYSLLDLSPEELCCDWLDRLIGWVEPGGRLIIGSYGSRSRGFAPEDVAKIMERCGLAVEGSGTGGDPVLTNFAWSKVERDAGA